MVNGTALLVLPAGPSPLLLLPDGGAWKAGVRNPARPRRPRLPPPGAGGAGVSLTQRTLSAGLSAVSRVCGSPRGGEGRSAAAPLRLGALAFWLVPLDRPGSSLRCPRPSRWCRFPLPVTSVGSHPAKRGRVRGGQQDLWFGKLGGGRPFPAPPGRGAPCRPAPAPRLSALSRGGRWRWWRARPPHPASGPLGFGPSLATTGCQLTPGAPPVTAAPSRAPRTRPR